MPAKRDGPLLFGPVGTQNVGICMGGFADCDAQGLSIGKCVGDIVPASENCATAADESCDGASPVCAGAYLRDAKLGDGQPQTGAAITFDSAGDLLVAGKGESPSIQAETRSSRDTSKETSISAAAR